MDLKRRPIKLSKDFFSRTGNSILSGDQLDGLLFRPSSESFCDKGFWMDKGSEFLTDPNSTCDDPSRIQTNRSQRWFVVAGDSEILPNKKQAVRAPNGKTSYEFPIANISPWENASNFQSVPKHYIHRMFGSETALPIQYLHRDLSSLRTDGLNT